MLQRISLLTLLRALKKWHNLRRSIRVYPYCNILSADRAGVLFSTNRQIAPEVAIFSHDLRPYALIHAL
jgi:hypothetical protein